MQKHKAFTARTQRLRLWHKTKNQKKRARTFVKKTGPDKLLYCDPALRYDKGKPTDFQFKASSSVDIRQPESFQNKTFPSSQDPKHTHRRKGGRLLQQCDYTRNLPSRQACRILQSAQNKHTNGPMPPRHRSQTYSRQSDAYLLPMS